MNPLQRFAASIHENFRKSSKQRAFYLFNMYCKSGFASPSSFYLDVGSGLGENSRAFGKLFEQTFRIDRKKTSMQNFIKADAAILPLKKNSFDAVSLFSVIEHIENQDAALEEAKRILKPNGTVIIQVPNRFFPIDLHNGLPLLHMLPRSIRKQMLRLLGFAYQSSISIPAKSKILKSFADREFSVAVLKVNYPVLCIPRGLQMFYRVLLTTKLLELFPLGYMIIAKRG